MIPIQFVWSTDLARVTVWPDTKDVDTVANLWDPCTMDTITWGSLDGHWSHGTG
jgi:hypothetical protein